MAAVARLDARPLWLRRERLLLSGPDSAAGLAGEGTPVAAPLAQGLSMTDRAAAIAAAMWASTAAAAAAGGKRLGACVETHHPLPCASLLLAARAALYPPGCFVVSCSIVVVG